jgi:hypothetical protein
VISRLEARLATLGTLATLGASASDIDNEAYGSNFLNALMLAAPYYTPDIPTCLASDHSAARQFYQPAVRFENSHKTECDLSASDQVRTSLINVRQRNVRLLPTVLKPIEQTGSMSQVIVDLGALEEAQGFPGIMLSQQDAAGHAVF